MTTQTIIGNETRVDYRHLCYDEETGKATPASGHLCVGQVIGGNYMATTGVEKNLKPVYSLEKYPTEIRVNVSRNVAPFYA